MTGRPPYPGLRSFDRDEAQVFFGRDRCLDGMAQTLQDTRFLAVLGPSGSGKSSLVRSGLFMHLEAGLAPKAGSRWTFLDIRHPRTHPFRELARATLECEREAGDGDPAGAERGSAPDEAALDERRRALQTGPLSLVRWWRDHPRHPNANLLVLVDQFEELFGYTTPKERDEVEAFVDLLLRTAGGDELDIYVVLTMRSEFLGGCALFPGLAEQINRSLSLTPRMTRDECRSAITGPAYGEELTLEPLLVTTLLNDMNSLAQFDEPAAGEAGDDEAQPVAELRQSDLIARRADQLPLMQHLLNWMWMLAAARGKPDEPIHLTLDDYLALGGLRGAMSRHAREVMDSTGEPELTSRIFRALTDQPAVATSGSAESSAVRRRRTVAELAEETGASEDRVRAVVDAFRAEGVSMLTPEPGVPLTSDIEVDVTHESLIRQWSDLSGWIREEAESGRAWQELLRDVDKRKQLRGLDLAERRGWWQRSAPHAGWAVRYGGGFAAVDAALTADWRAERRRKLIWRAGTAGLAALGAASAGVFVVSSSLAANARDALKVASDAATEADARTARAVAEADEAQRLARQSQAEAKKHSAEAKRAAATASAATAEAARRVHLANVQIAAARAEGQTIRQKSQELSQKLKERAYAQLQLVWEKKPQDAREWFDWIKEDADLVHAADPAVFDILQPELEKAHGDFLTFELDTPEMLKKGEESLTLAERSMFEVQMGWAKSDAAFRAAIRASQAETLIGRVERFQGRPQDALASFDRAASVVPSEAFRELSLARAEAQYERASTLLDGGQLGLAAEAAAQCRDSANAAEQERPLDASAEAEEQMRLRPPFALWRCQTILAATAKTEAEAAVEWDAAADTFAGMGNLSESEDIALPRADFLVRYFRRPRATAVAKLPEKIESLVDASLSDIVGGEGSGFVSTGAVDSTRELYPLVALHRINFHNEYVKWLLQKGSIDLPRTVAIMKATDSMFDSVLDNRSGGVVSEELSQAYDMHAANWIALERFVDPRNYRNLEAALPGAARAIEGNWDNLRATMRDGADAGTLTRVRRLRVQAVDLVKAAHSQQAYERFGALADTGGRLLGRLCSAKGLVPPDENCENLRTAVTTVQAEEASLARSLASPSPRGASKSKTAVPVWEKDGVALGGIDPVTCFDQETISNPSAESAVQEGSEAEGNPNVEDDQYVRRCHLRKGRLRNALKWGGQIWLFERASNQRMFLDSGGLQSPNLAGIRSIVWPRGRWTGRGSSMAR